MSAIRPGACPSPLSPSDSTILDVTALSALRSDVGETHALATLNYLSPPLVEGRRRVMGLPKVKVGWPRERQKETEGCEIRSKRRGKEKGCRVTRRTWTLTAFILC